MGDMGKWVTGEMDLLTAFANLGGFTVRQGLFLYQKGLRP